MALPEDRPAPAAERLPRALRPVHPEKLSAEERFAYTHFLYRVRSFVIIKAIVNALLVLLFMVTVMPDSPGTVLVAVADGLLLLPYFLLVRRWPVLSTIVLLCLSTVAISAADAASGFQTFTSGVFYATLIVVGAVLLLDPGYIAVITSTITSIFVLTYLLEMTGVVPVTMTLLTPRAILRVMTLHTLSFLGIGALSGVLTHLYRQLLVSRSQQTLQRALLEGFREISANVDLHTLLQRIAERAVATLPAADRALLMVTEGDWLVVRGVAGFAPLNPVGRRVALARTEQYLHEPAVLADVPEPIQGLLVGETAGPPPDLSPARATLLFPLQNKGNLRILLSVSNTRRADAFNDETQQIVDLFASQAAVAIENAQLLTTSQARLQQEMALSRIGQEIASLLQMPALVPAIYQHIKQVMDAPSFLIAVRRPQDDDLELISPIDVGQVYPDRTVPSQGVLGWVVANRRPLRFGDLQREIVTYPEIRIQPLHSTTFIPGSLLAVPLVVGNQVIGALSIQSPDVNAYVESDEQFLAALANYVAVAVQNARLYDQVQQKQTELQGLISAVSDRLQGPVEALAGFARLLRETSAKPPSGEQTDYLERIERNSRWIAQLTQDMLFLSRLGQVQEEHEPIVLGTLVHGVATHLELERQGILVDIQQDMPTLSADPVLMWTLFRNLLQNSCRLLQESAAPRIEVGCRQVDEGHRLSVRGNGQSLPQEQLGHAFDLFFPIGGSEGAGIGLAVAQRIAQHYAGRVWAEAGPGQGTTFYLQLPLEAVKS